MLEQGLDVAVIGLSPIVTPDAVSIASGAFEELPGAYTIQTVDTTKPEYQELIEEYSAAHDDVTSLPEQAVQVYDAVTWVADGLRESDGACGAELANALEQLPSREGLAGLAGTEQGFTGDKHDAFIGKALVPYLIEDGAPVQDTSLKLK
jgi:ABC-type branched-subunit amino acid transport system substrate-binding protein